MAARKRPYPGQAWTPDRVRERIKVSLLVNRLADHVLGKKEMTATQVRAAEILLRKAVPDLSAVEHSGEISNRTVNEISRDELLDIAAGGRAGASEAGRRSVEPAGIH